MRLGSLLCSVLLAKPLAPLQALGAHSGSSVWLPGNNYEGGRDRESASNTHPVTRKASLLFNICAVATQAYAEFRTWKSMQR